MADYLTLTEFVPGTKAKAQEVNANFSALKDAVNQKASMEGDSTQTFLVAGATQDEHAVNKLQLNNLSSTLTAEINKTGTKFCAKSGNTTSGKGDLFSYSVLRIIPKIGAAFGDLIISDYRGVQSAISSAAEISMSGKPDGEHNIFITPAGTLYTLKNTIYRQATRPTMLDGDVWFNTSVKPFKCIKYSGTGDTEFLDVPLGKVTVLSAAITALETFAFNQNGYDVSAQTTLKKSTNLATSISNLVMPDYVNAVSKSFSIVYQAESDAFIYIKVRYSGTFYVSSDNSTWIPFTICSFSDQGYVASTVFPISKGLYYKAITGDSANSSLKFCPCLAT